MNDDREKARVDGQFRGTARHSGGQRGLQEAGRVVNLKRCPRKQKNNILEKNRKQ